MRHEPQHQLAANRWASFHSTQPTGVAIEDDAVLGGSMGVLYSAHNVGCNREESCSWIKRLAVVSTRIENVIYAMNETLKRNLMRTLNYSSHRRRLVSSSLIFLDSGLRRNDKFRIIQRLFSKPVFQFISFSEVNTHANP